jgi:hypothetical protein
MKKDIEKIGRLKSEKTGFLTALQSVPNNPATNNPVILEFLKEKVQEKNADIYKEEHRKEPKSNIKVKFSGSGKEIYNSTAIETYLQTILEFGVNKVKPYFPDLFVKEPKTGKVKNPIVSENIYLKASLSNKEKKRHIEDISDKLRIRVTVKIIKE